MPGICTSATTHETSSGSADCKKSSADANVWTRYPCELRRLSVAVRTDASSSMTEITESVDKTGLPEAESRHLPWQVLLDKCAMNRSCKTILRFVGARTYCD